MPQPFTEKSRWEDWKITFYNFLKTQPGRSGVPLAYIVREVDNQSDAHEELLDNYI